MAELLVDLCQYPSHSDNPRYATATCVVNYLPARPDDSRYLYRHSVATGQRERERERERRT